MPSTQSSRVLDLAAQKHLLTAADLRVQGLRPQTLLKHHADGRLTRVARGVYTLPEAPFTPNQNLIEVCRRVPKAVICLLTALHFHEVGTQLPSDIWIALPEATPTPRIDHPPLRIVRLRGSAYTDGIETKMESGMPIRVYSLAKTITDCFKFRNKIGLDVALEALKDAWRKRRVTMNDIEHFAGINRVSRVMRPYLEGLVA